MPYRESLLGLACRGILHYRHISLHLVLSRPDIDPAIAGGAGRPNGSPQGDNRERNISSQMEVCSHTLSLLRLAVTIWLRSKYSMKIVVVSYNQCRDLSKLWIDV